MGLDLTPLARAREGHESEWHELVTRSLNNLELTDQQVERFEEISLQPYEVVGAPQVGADAAADDWIAGELADRMSRDEAIEAGRGFFALHLTQSDGLPKYTHAGMYEGVDETCFRGSFLEDCVNVLSPEQIEAAWENRMPADAERYGKELLQAVEDVRQNGPRKTRKVGLFGLGRRRAESTIELEEQIDIVATAGRWFVFWGERGHPIHAYY